MDHIYQKIDGRFTFPRLYSFLADQIPPSGSFAEIGVWKGKSLSYFIVESIKRKKDIQIYAIDTWGGSIEHADFESIKNGTLFSEFTDNLSSVSGKYIPIMAKSDIASEKFPNESFDAVFIDASHDYENVSKDISCWYPKVKAGGFFCGHDYQSSWPEVKRAVDDFLTKNSLSPFLLGDETCWGIRKPIN